jgi:hypothetical protein
LVVVVFFFLALAAVSAADVARLRVPDIDGGGERERWRPLLVLDGVDRVCMGR